MLEWFLSSAILLAVLIALHYLLRGKVSPKLQYALWALALVRLLLPFSVGQSAASVENLVPETRHYVLYTAPRTNPEADTTTPSQPQQAAQPPVQVLPAREAAETQKAVRGGSVLELKTVLTVVWAVGAAGVLLWFFGCNLAFGRALQKDATLFAPASPGCPAIYVSPAIASPCLFGFLRPAIYLTPDSAADDALRRHCIAHEQTHYRHGDHLWALLRGICLALHWFDPLAWWSAHLARTDAELCCDEDAIRLLGEGERADYGRTLIRMTCRTRIDPLSAATTMSGRGSQLKERVRAIAKHPKTAVPVLIAVLLIAAIAAGCTMTGAKQKGTAQNTTATAEAGTTSDTASARRDAILTRLQEVNPAEVPGVDSAEPSTAKAISGFADYLLRHYDQLDARGFFADDTVWEPVTLDDQEFHLVVRDKGGNRLDVISYNAQYDIADDAAYRCSQAMTSALPGYDPGIGEYVQSTQVRPSVQFASYLAEHGKEWQDSAIWDYNTTWSLRKLDDQILLHISNLPNGSIETFSMDCETLAVTYEPVDLDKRKTAIEAKLNAALTSDIVRDDTYWFPLRELDEEKKQTALTAYTVWLISNFDALLQNGVLEDDIHWELLATASGEGNLVLRSDETRTPYFYYCLYYDAETGHVDDFDPRLMSALKESNVQDPELAQTAQVTFAAYFRGHYDELEPLGIFRYGARWTIRLTDGDLFLDAETLTGGTEQFIFTPDTGLVHRSGEAADAPGAFESVWVDFAVNWRLDYLPVFSDALYPENNGVPDAASEYLMWLYATNMDELKAQGYMDADWVETTIQAHFPIRRLSMDDLPKTWVFRNGRYEPVATGVNPKPLVRLDSLEADVSDERTVYTAKYTFFSAGHEIADEAEWQQLRSNILAGDLSGLWEDHVDTFEFYFESGQPVFLSHSELMICASYNAAMPLQAEEFTLPRALRFGMSYDEALRLCGSHAENEDSGDGWKSFQCEGYHYAFYNDALSSVYIRSVADGGNMDPTTPIFREIHLGESSESVFDKFPCTDRELKQWELQTVYDDGEGHTADLQFVANSFYALRFCTPEGYTAMLTFAHADNTVAYIDLYAPGM